MASGGSSTTACASFSTLVASPGLSDHHRHGSEPALPTQSRRAVVPSSGERALPVRPEPRSGHPRRSPTADMVEAMALLAPRHYVASGQNGTPREFESPWVWRLRSHEETEPSLYW